MSIWKTACKYAGCALIGTAGIKLLSSKDAKKAYTHATAAVLRCKDEVMSTVIKIKENCEDIKADAEDINEERYEKERQKEIEDAKNIIAEAEERLKDLGADEAVC